MLDVRLATRWPGVPALGLFTRPAPGGGVEPPEGADRLDADRANLAGFLADVEATGEAGSVHTLPLPGSAPKVVHVLGVGDGTPAAWRRSGAALARAARKAPAVVAHLPRGLSNDAVRAITEGLTLASYAFTRKSAPEPAPLQRATLIVENERRYAAAVDAGVCTARATCLARDLVNAPSLEKSPEWLAAEAEQAAKRAGLSVTVRTPDRLAKDAFGAILAVGQGSTRGPRLIEVTYTPRRAGRHVVLVGKGITFDSGGLSLKPVENMKLMKKDMGGGAAVLGAAIAAADRSLPVRVTALVPAAENMPSGTAQRPGDVITHYGGRTTEVLNTDAEGRLVLADALAYAQTLRPDLVIDLATLTGAQSVALGKRTAALFTDDDALAAALGAAADSAGESLWRMPLVDDYRSALNSPVADLRNVAGPDVGAGAVVAALFLREFARPSRWAHLDMSGPAWVDADADELVRGATGWGVRTLLRFLEEFT